MEHKKTWFAFFKTGFNLRRSTLGSVHLSACVLGPLNLPNFLNTGRNTITLNWNYCETAIHFPDVTVKMNGGRYIRDLFREGTDDREPSFCYSYNPKTKKVT